MSREMVIKFWRWARASREMTRPSSHLNLGSLQQLGRLISGDLWKRRFQGICERQRSLIILFPLPPKVTMWFPASYGGCWSTYASTKLVHPIPWDVTLPLFHAFPTFFFWKSQVWNRQGCFYKMYGDLGVPGWLRGRNMWLLILGFVS